MPQQQSKEGDKQELQTKANIDFIWLYNSHPEEGSQLAGHVVKLSLLVKNRSAYIAAEVTN